MHQKRLAHLVEVVQRAPVYVGAKDLFRIPDLELRRKPVPDFVELIPGNYEGRVVQSQELRVFNDLTLW